MNTTETGAVVHDGWMGPVEKQGVATSPPTPRRTARAKLKTVGNVAEELAKIYRAVAGGKLDSQEGCRRTYILAMLAKMIEGSELERRIESLEQRGNGQ